MRTSGIRLGTPAVTTRGFGAEEMRVVAELIHEAISQREDARPSRATRERAIALATRFPLPGVHLSPSSVQREDRAAAGCTRTHQLRP